MRDKQTIREGRLAMMQAEFNKRADEAALSAAEPVGWQWRHPRATGGEWMNCPNGPRADKLSQAEYRPVYADPPPPSVAVKALEWKEDGKYLRARMGDREYSLNITADGETWAGCTRPYAFGTNLTWSTVPNCSMVSLEAAKAACQADCQSRYAALSAQVQDVAGTETTTRFHIEWIAGARPPVHPNPMTGRTTFESFELAVQHMKSQADDAQFVSLEERRTTIVHIDRSADMRAALPAAPAKQEG